MHQNIALIVFRVYVPGMVERSRREGKSKQASISLFLQVKAASIEGHLGNRGI